MDLLGMPCAPDKRVVGVIGNIAFGWTLSKTKRVRIAKSCGIYVDGSGYTGFSAMPS